MAKLASKALPWTLGMILGGLVYFPSAGSAVWAASLDVEEIGSFHVGGGEKVLEGLASRELSFGPNTPPITVDPNGEFEVGQMYVQYVTLANPKAKYPLLLWHGGGLTGVTWETKPDGEPGWQMFFLNAGHDVYVSDAVERGRASWARFPEIYPGEPFFRTKKEGWTLFRFGPEWTGDASTSKVFEGQQFPVAAYDQFAKQAVPRWSTNNALIQAAYDELVERVCPCVLLVHSQGSGFGFQAALNNPSKIMGMVAVEPSGALPAETNAEPLKDIPFLFVWGDYLDQENTWKTSLYPNLQRWQTQLAEAGAKVTVLDLPKQGIRGNSHMLMMDRNSDEVAKLVQDWIAEQNLMKE